MRPILSLLSVLALTSLAHASDPPAPQLPPTDDANATLSWDDAAPALVCQDQRQFWAGSCAGAFTLTLHAKRAIRPLRATLTTSADTGKKTLYEYEAALLRPEQRWQTPIRAHIYQAGRWTFTLTYADEAGREHQLAASIDITNPAREAVQAQCVECKGELRAWGLLGREWCNCGTKDAGQPCDDERGCEGACLVVKGATPRDKPGVCAPRAVTFGCHTRIIHDPAHPAGRRASQICAD